MMKKKLNVTRKTVNTKIPTSILTTPTLTLTILHIVSDPKKTITIFVTIASIAMRTILDAATLENLNHRIPLLLQAPTVTLTIPPTQLTIVIAITTLLSPSTVNLVCSKNAIPTQSLSQKLTMNVVILAAIMD